MAATQSSDFAFVPKIWSDHIKAYFDRFLVFGAFAVRNNDLQAEGTGLTVNFPYFKAIGDAETPAENGVLTVDKLSDDSFSCTVFEVAKAVGFTKKAFKASAASANAIMAEAQRQLARVHAEKVDKALLTEIETAGEVGFNAAADADTTKITTLNTAKMKAFGDKHRQAVVAFMHSLQVLDMMNDSTSGFLKADANDPMAMVQGFAGRMLGMAIIENDNMSLIAPGGAITKNRYRSVICKEGAFGIIAKQEMELDSDKDVLARQYLVTSNEWYGVKNFHAKVHAQDKKIAFMVTTTNN